MRPASNNRLDKSRSKEFGSDTILIVLKGCLDLGGQQNIWPNHSCVLFLSDFIMAVINIFLILPRLRPSKLITKTCFQARFICVSYFFSHAHYSEIKGTFVSEDISLD